MGDRKFWGKSYDDSTINI